MATSNETHSSLIQGISQQAENARGTGSCKYQENCLNEVLDGVVSRMGSRVVKAYNWGLSGPMVHEINRTEDEKYLVIVDPAGIKVLNRITGQQCTISGNISAYLTHTGESRKAFRAVTVGDTTFLLNRQKVVAMDSQKSPARPNMSCAYFRAGGYKVTYKLTIKIGSTEYSISYETPDNSAAGNAAHITTDHLAEQFQQAFTSTLLPALNDDGHTGFTLQRYGSTLVIEGPASKSYTLSTSDGVGDTHLKSFNGSVDGISDLPKRCKPGYIVSVSPPGSQDAARYWLKYTGSHEDGRWEEVVAPNTVLGLDPATMPHLLVNTGLNTFEVKQATWGKRLSGDGDRTSPDPSFVGYPIRDLQFISGRLAAVTEYTSVLSRARNAYVYFPDTAQTKLDTAPIDYDVSNGSATNIEFALAIGGRLQFWGYEQQTYLDPGQDAIKEESTDILPLANYEFDGECSPKVSGQSSMLFSTSVGAWSKLTELIIQKSVIQGEIIISDHVPKLIPGSVRSIAVGEAARKAFILSSGAPNTAFLYQWYNQGQDRVQSAWNPWTFPAVDRIHWVGVRGGEAHFLLDWGTHTSLEAIKLDSIGDEPTEPFPLRLDHRVSEQQGVFGEGVWTVILPYPVKSANRGLFRCFERKDSAGEGLQRGREVPIEWVNSTTVRVRSSNPSLKFYIGVIPVARRVASRFFARDRQGETILHDRLLIYRVMIFHEKTASYDVVVRSWGGEETVSTYTGRVLGDPMIINDEVPIKTGNHIAPINEETEDVEIELVNPYPYPCIWSAKKYTYELTERPQ